MAEARSEIEAGGMSYEGRRTSFAGEGEVVLRSARRRWHPQQKLAIVQESLGNGLGPTQVARRYGISTALLYTWRKQLLSAATEGFVACEVVDAGAAVPLAPAPLTPVDPAPGLIEVELPGGARLRIGSGSDPTVLRVVLDALVPR